MRRRRTQQGAAGCSRCHSTSESAAFVCMTDQSTHTHAVLAAVADALIQACLYRTCATVGGGGGCSVCVLTRTIFKVAHCCMRKTVTYNCFCLRGLFRSTILGNIWYKFSFHISSVRVTEEGVWVTAGRRLTSS